MNMHDVHKIEVNVLGDKYEITVGKTGKVTWKAFGYINDEFVQGQGAKSRNMAIENWKIAAKYKLDD